MPPDLPIWLCFLFGCATYVLEETLLKDPVLYCLACCRQLLLCRNQLHLWKWVSNKRLNVTVKYYCWETTITLEPYCNKNGRTYLKINEVKTRGFYVALYLTILFIWFYTNETYTKILHVHLLTYIMVPVYLKHWNKDLDIQSATE